MLAVALLEPLEARDARREGDDLPVGDEVPRRLVLERLGDLGVLVVHAALRARHQAHAALVAIAMQRIPSSLRSKIHSGSEKGLSDSTAFIGSITGPRSSRFPA